MGQLKLVQSSVLLFTLFLYACGNGSKGNGATDASATSEGSGGAPGSGGTAGPDASTATDSGTSKKGICGDGKLDDGEECDDGNVSNGDGCDSTCKAELVFRLTRLKILTDSAPDYCVYAGNKNHGNAVGALFPSSTMLDAMGGLMNGSFSDGTANVLEHVLDLDSRAADTPDTTVNIGISQGALAADWSSQSDKLDFPVTLNASAVDTLGLPKTFMVSQLVDKGNGLMELQSLTPGKAGFTGPGNADFTLYNAMARLEVDSARSQPQSPPTFADSLKMPESLGHDADAAPQGRLCGAMLASSFQTIGMPGMLAGLCAMLSSSTFTACDSTTPAKDPTKGECDSILTLLQKGCPPLLNPIGDPDADTDGDGTNDGYSVVVGLSAKRVKVTGIK
jgi:cysteine-rich repeat protein